MKKNLVKAHQPCDACGSSDALAEYVDGTYCFSCRAYRKKFTEKSYFPIVEDVYNQESTSLKLPLTSNKRLPSSAKAWLLSYNIYKDLRDKYDIRYVHEEKINNIILKQRIILPNYVDGQLKFYQARRVIELDYGPKYYTFGDKDYLFYSKTEVNEHNAIVLVEDMISAMRVGEFVQAVSLTGTSLSQKNLLTLAQKFATIIIWMDGDRAGRNASRKLKKQLSLVHPSIYEIYTNKDPKCLTDGDIKKHLASVIA